uniref:MI domain-containing protein n=1 Tax=Globisporangium ultimum (strain ATCC 200006 / CBS 805.95 / DAOM BR144) TaxID=431595 RepID=K3X0S8_GLOUD
MQEEAAKAAGGGAPTAVLPSKMDDQALRELTRRLNGQLNRISEANMESISLEVEKIYREYPRSVVNQILLDKILQTACHRGIVMTPMIKVCGALIAALYHSIGSEVGGFFIEKIVLKMVESVKESVADAANHEENGDEDDETSTSKEPINLLLFVAMLYNFGVVHCTLVYDLFRSFVTNFSSVEVELIHQLLKVSGHQLRSDDADALKDMVASVQQKVASLSQGNDKPQERVRFILDLIYDLKKPSKKKSRQGGAGGMEMDLSSLKKWLGRVKTRVGNANNPLRISLHELLHADQDGRWWIVGGTWVGYQKAKNGDDADDDAHSKERDEENRLVKLAEKQRMNTDVRKKIFVAIMGASDCLDAYERLLQLHLKEKQEREIVRVLLHCSGQEKKFNKYYLVLADKLCEMDPRYKFTFQLAFWDIFKQFDTFKPRKLYNLAQMLAGLIISKSLSLSCLKVLDFTDLPEKSILFMRVVLEKILKLEDELEMAQVFQRLLQTKKAQLTIDGLAVFVHQHLTNFHSEEDAAVRALLKKRSKSVKSLLDHLAKSAASSEKMEGFM